MTRNKKIGTLLSVILVALVGIYVFLDRKAFVTKYVLPRISVALNQPVEANVVGFSIFGTVMLEDVLVGRKPDVLRIDKLSISYDLGAVLVGRIKIHRMTLSGVDARLTEEFLLGFKRKDDGGTLLQIEVLEINEAVIQYRTGDTLLGVRDLQLSMSNVGDHQVITVDGKADVEVDGMDGMDGAFKIKGATCRGVLDLSNPPIEIKASVTIEEFPYRQILLTDVAGSIQYKAHSLLFDHFKGSIGNGTLSASGQVDLAGSAGLKYNFDVKGRDIEFRPIIDCYPKWRDSFVFQFDGNAGDLAVTFNNTAKGNAQELFYLDAKLRLNYFDLNEFNGPYANSMVFLLRALSLHVGDLRFKGGHAHHMIQDGQYIIHESTMGDTGLTLSYEGRIEMNKEEAATLQEKVDINGKEEDVGIWLWAELVEGQAKQVDEKYIDLRRLAGDRFQTPKIRLRGDLASSITVMRIISNFVVKPAFRETFRSALGTVQGSGELTWKGLELGKDITVGAGDGFVNLFRMLVPGSDEKKKADDKAPSTPSDETKDSAPVEIEKKGKSKGSMPGETGSIEKE